MSEDDLSDVWARSLADLADMQIEPHQRAWLQLTRPLGLVENTALIAAPNEFVKDSSRPGFAHSSPTPCPGSSPATSSSPSPSTRPPLPTSSHPLPRQNTADDDITGPDHAPRQAAAPGICPAARHRAATATPSRPSPDLAGARRARWRGTSPARHGRARPPAGAAATRAAGCQPLTGTSNGQPGQAPLPRCINPAPATAWPASRRGPARRG